MTDRIKTAWDDPELRYTWLITMGALAVLAMVHRGFKTA